MKAAFLIRSLEYGGAERQLIALAKGLRSRGHDVVVGVFYPGGPLEQDLKAADIRVRSLDKRGRWDTAGFSRRLFRWLEEEQPHVLHSYLVVANVMTIPIRARFPDLRVVWGVRDALKDLRKYDWFIRGTVQMQRLFSGLPHLIVANSRAGRDHHLRSGFPAAKLVVIPNGIETSRFRPDLEAGRRVRAEWGISDGAPLIGCVGRLDPIKDHGTFLEAAAALANERADVRFVCVGDGPVDYRGQLHAKARSLRLDGRIVWAGARHDITAVQNALDVACSASQSEAFPNVIAEAMACGVPCVVTDVGDSAWLVQDTGLVVPPRDPQKLAGGLREMLEWREREGVERLSARARERIEREFGLDILVERTTRVLEALL
jgi:glycosyltransferase involved in cell wall biosynthesis